MTNLNLDPAQIAGLSDEDRDRMLLELLRQQQQTKGDDHQKVEDALLLLKLRPKIAVETYNPLTRRTDKRIQDRKLWDVGIIDPLANEDQPHRPQVVRVVAQPSGEVLFERTDVLPLPVQGAPVAVGNYSIGQTDPGDPGDDVTRLLAKLRQRPELRKALAELLDDDGGAGEGGDPAPPPSNPIPEPTPARTPARAGGRKGG